MTGTNGMSDDERLRALFHDAVSDVEPHDGLGEVRRRTRVRRTSSRRWAPVLVGAGAVAATVVAATFVVNGVSDDPERPDDPQVASNGPTSDSEDQVTAAAALYFVGATPTGPRLYREFQAVTPTTDPEQKVLTALQRLTFGPRDPDYRTLWPTDSFEGVRVEDDRIVVEIGAEALAPAGPAASLGLQQAVYTAEGALGDTLPLAFERDSEPVRTVLGFRVGAVVDRDRGFDLTAPVNITDPSEQLTIEEDSVVANGTVSANAQWPVTWTLRRAGVVVAEGEAVPLDITGPDARATLHAPGWETEELDLSGLAPGEYVFEVTVLDAGQTSDRPTAFSDTRTITVR